MSEGYETRKRDEWTHEGVKGVRITTETWFPDDPTGTLEFVAAKDSPRNPGTCESGQAALLLDRVAAKELGIALLTMAGAPPGQEREIFHAFKSAGGGHLTLRLAIVEESLQWHLCADDIYPASGSMMGVSIIRPFIRKPDRTEAGNRE